MDHSAAFDAAPTDAVGSEPLRAIERLGVGLWQMQIRAGEISLSAVARQLLRIGPHERVRAEELARHAEEGQRAAFLAFLTSSERDRDPVPFHVTLRLFDHGEARRFEWNAVAEADDGLGPRLPWGVVTDVTDRSRRTAALAGTRATLEACLRRADDAIVILDRDARVRDANRRGCDFFGIRDVNGPVLWDLNPTLADDRFRAAFRTAVNGGNAVEEERHVPALDSWVAYSFTPAADAVVLVIKARDEVFRLRSLVDVLARRWQSASTAGAIDLWEFDLDTDLIKHVRAGEPLLDSRVFGFAELRSRIAAEDRPQIDLLRARAPHDREPFRSIVRMQRSDGGVRTVELRGAVSRSEPGAGRRLAGVAFTADEAGRTEAASPRPAESAHLSGAQVRAARGALRWSVRELAEASGVSVATINRFEADSQAVVTRDTSVAALRRVLGTHGVTFFTSPDGRPAIAFGA